MNRHFVVDPKTRKLVLKSETPVSKPAAFNVLRTGPTVDQLRKAAQDEQLLKGNLAFDEVNRDDHD